MNFSRAQSAFALAAALALLLMLFGCPAQPGQAGTGTAEETGQGSDSAGGADVLASAGESQPESGGTEPDFGAEAGPPQAGAEPAAEPGQEPAEPGSGAQEPQGSTAVVDSFSLVNSLGYYHVTGIIENTGSIPVKHARANVIIHTADGKEDAYEDVIVYPARLAPGEKGGFDLTLGKAEGYDTGNFNVQAGSFVVDDTNPYTALKVENLRSDDSGGYYRAYATIQNTGNEQAPMYWVKALFYNAEGHVLNTGTSALVKGGEGIKPGESIEVSFVVAHPNSSLQITSHAAFVDFS